MLASVPVPGGRAVQRRGKGGGEREGGGGGRGRESEREGDRDREGGMDRDREGGRERDLFFSRTHEHTRARARTRTHTHTHTHIHLRQQQAAAPHPELARPAHRGGAQAPHRHLQRVQRLKWFKMFCVLFAAAVQRLPTAGFAFVVSLVDSRASV